MSVEARALMASGPTGESGKFSVEVRSGEGVHPLAFDASYDHNGIIVTGPRDMHWKVTESMRGWGGDIATSSESLARAAFEGWLGQFGAKVEQPTGEEN